MTEQQWLSEKRADTLLAWRHEMDQVNPPPRGRGWGMVGDRKLLLWVAAVGRKCPGWKGSISVGTAQDVEALADASDATIRSECYPPGLAESVSIRFGDAEWSADFLREIVGNPFRPATVWRTDKGLHPIRDGSIHLQESWLTPTVLSLAQAAYDERGAACAFCYGKGCFQTPNSYSECPRCLDATGKGTGRVDDGTLDPHRLAVLSDRLEEAGCPTEVICPSCDGTGQQGPCGLTDYYRNCYACWDDERYQRRGRIPAHPILTHLRSPGPHYRGMWSLDLVLGKESS